MHYKMLLSEQLDFSDLRYVITSTRLNISGHWSIWYAVQRA